MRNPETVSGRVWVEQYFRSLKQFVVSGRRDTDALREAARHLSFLIQREPAYARETRQLALQCASGAYNIGHPGAISALVQTALDAEVMSPDLAKEPSPTLLLMLYQAEAERLDGRRLDGLATIDEMLERLGPEHPPDPLYEFVRARGAMVRAELEELEREFERAWRGFDDARAAMAALIADPEPKQALVDDYIAQVFGPRDTSIAGQIDGLASTFSLLLAQTYLSALLGCLRTARDAEPDRVITIARELTEAAAVHGLVYGASPFVLAQAIAGLPPEEAAKVVAGLTEARAAATFSVLAEGRLEGMDPQLVETLRASSEPSDEEAEEEQVLWNLTMAIARAKSLECAGDLSAADKLYRDAVERSLHERGGLLKVYAIGAMAAYFGRVDKLSRGIVQMFFFALGGILQVDPEVFDDLRYRALIDEPVLHLTTWALTQPDALASTENRLRMSVLLDLLRRRHPPASEVLIGLGRHDVSEGIRPSALTMLANGLERITDAVASMPGVLVLIGHNDGSETYFISVDDEATGVWQTPPEFSQAIEALEAAAEDQVISGPRGDGVDSVLEPANAAFEAFPDRIREKMNDADMLLVVPDFQWNADVIPYELLHDGDSYLMESSIVARFTSLEHLARSLDANARRLQKRRALITAAPQGDPTRPLYTAIPERDAILGSLEEAGFDVPRIEPERLDSDFFCDRLTYIDVLHVAAHGESAAGAEYIVLGVDKRMSVDDLEAAKPATLPFVYLNTCQLAKTRYLGGGQARGLAFTFSELGAPAVLANSTDVLDEVSMAIATAFYDKVLSTGVGEALRETRRQVIYQGYHPALVGRVVLFGNPFFALAGQDDHAADFDLATQLLDSYFFASNEEAAAQARARVEQTLALGEPDIRLLAAVDLALELEKVEGLEADAKLRALSEAIELADGLRHPPAQALLRYLRAKEALDAADDGAVRWMGDAISHLKRLQYWGDPWGRLLLEMRGELRQIELNQQGIKFRRMGPQDDDDGVMEAFTKLIMATQQGQEEELGKVTLRPREDTMTDIAWNAVVVGHPNRFEDPAEAADFARFLTAKLISQGHLREPAEPYAHAMLIGLLWYLWSTQKVTYLEPQLAEAQTGTLMALIDNIRSDWSPPSEGATKAALEGFVASVDETLAYLEELTWADVVLAIKERIPALATEAEELLDRIARTDPFSLAASAAYVTGVLAIKNTFSPLEGSVPEDKQTQMTSALWKLSNANESRFRPYLTAGFEPVQSREPDELHRWRMETD